MAKHYLSDENEFTVQDGKGEKYILKVNYDDYAEDPRNFDNFGTMVCWHRRYTFGDKHSYSDPHNFLYSLCKKFCDLKQEDEDECSFEELYTLLNNSDKIIILPLSIYDHSGVTMFVGDPSDPWDSSQVGFIYVDKESTAAYVGPSKQWKDEAKEWLEHEVHLYDLYLQGHCYYYSLIGKVKKQEFCPHCGKVISEYEDEEVLDTTGGFYGETLEETGIMEDLPAGFKLVEE